MVLNYLEKYTIRRLKKKKTVIHCYISINYRTIKKMRSECQIIKCGQKTNPMTLFSLTIMRVWVTDDLLIFTDSKGNDPNAPSMFRRKNNFTQSTVRR